MQNTEVFLLRNPNELPSGVALSAILGAIESARCYGMRIGERVNGGEEVSCHPTFLPRFPFSGAVGLWRSTIAFMPTTVFSRRSFLALSAMLPWAFRGV